MKENEMGMEKAVQRTSECILWEIPGPQRRFMGLMFEQDITPTASMAVGIVILPPETEQPKLSHHDESEEVYYIVRGKGRFVLDEEEYDVEAGTAVYVAPGVGHRAINSGTEEMEMFWVNAPSCFGGPGGYKEFTKDWKQVR
jgi:mannose-6-phosphate isomerase-like protein (cupin superfamily)